MAFVLDASIAIAWVVPTQSNAYAKRVRLLARHEPFHVPSIFNAEIANVLVALERRGILSAHGAETAASVLSRLEPVVHELDLTIVQLRAIAVRFGLSAYDASYLALALDANLPVACGDRPLKAALSKAGVKLFATR
ncbi:MAG TPA: type II toxin-antitoxin system VapC family toxin [Thermoanaerobaculia bacterium]|nr:type II toxin-antitoxin system VapC family toxin [Thermoanaerobaculia bacterium]